MSPEKQRIALPELLSMSDEEINKIAQHLKNWMPYADCCNSHDCAFNLRKGFTPDQIFDYLKALNDMNWDKAVAEKDPNVFIGDYLYRMAINATARQQTIAAVMVLQQGGV
jgi:hypothetical protein